MAGTLFYIPRAFVIDGSGDPRSGAKAFFYEAGTLTLLDTYSDVALTTPNANPVVADAAGVFGPIYLDNVDYRLILKDSNDVEIYDQDNINNQAVGLGSAVTSKGGNYTVVTGDRGKFIEVSATGTISLPAVADAGAGFMLAIFNTGTGVVTIDPNLTETINNVSTAELGPGEGAIISSDGDEWLGVITRVFGNKVNSQAAPYTILTSDRGALIVVTTAGTVTLPTVASAGAGFVVSVVNVGASDTTVDGNGAEEVNDGSDYTLPPFNGATFVCDGDEWFVIGNPPASVTQAGIVELATSAEVIAGSDATRAVTPDTIGDMLFAIRIDNDGTPTVLSSSDSASGWTVAADTLGQIVVTHSLALSSINDLIVTATATYEAAANTTGANALNVEVQSEGVDDFTVAVYQVDGTRIETGAVNIIAYRVA